MSISEYLSVSRTRIPIHYNISLYCACVEKKNEIRKQLRTGRHAATWDGKTEKNVIIIHFMI